MSVIVHHGDSREVLKTLADASVDAVVCDPPYALVSIGKSFGKEGAAPAKVGKSGAYARASAGFMGKKWDTGETAFDPEFWVEVLRVLKPGGHLIAFSGTRTYHRLACAIEDAGFEMRDMIAWLYGSGFPKSHDVSKGIDKARNDKPDIHKVAAFVAAGRDAAGFTNRQIDSEFGFNGMAGHWTNSKGPQAQVPKWDQWGRLKALISLSDDMDPEVWRLNGRKGTPGNEREITREASEEYRAGDAISFDQRASTARERRDIAVLDDAAKWQGWGTALKPALEPIVLARKPLSGTVAANVLQHGTGALNIDSTRVGEALRSRSTGRKISENLSMAGANYEREIVGEVEGRWPANVLHDGSDEVISAFPLTESGVMRAGTRRAAQDGPGSVVYGTYGGDATSADTPGDSGSAARFFYSAKADAEDRCGSKHPTVKPVDLMAWLCRLVTPPGGVILDPFAGSGSTGIAAMREGFDCILVEREAEYVADIHRRVAWATGEGRLTVLEQARDFCPAAAAGEDLPLFATQETAQPASVSSTGHSPATPDRADGDDEMVAA